MPYRGPNVHPVKTLTIDPCPLVQLGLRVLISSHSDMELVGEAADIVSIPQNGNQPAPDIVVVGCSIGEPAVAVAGIRKPYPGVSILFLLGHDDGSSPNNIDRAAGIGRITNPFVVVDAIRELCRGQDGNRLQFHDLSSREFAVLRQLTAGYTNRKVADHMGVSVKTVETYRLRINRKLGVRTRTDMMRCAMSLGISPSLESFLWGRNEQIKAQVSEPANRPAEKNKKCSIE